MKTDSATPPSLFSVVWNDSPGVSEKALRLRQSFQSACPMREAVGPQPVERVPERAVQVLVQRRFRAGLVVVGDRCVEDGAVAGLLHVRRDREHEPQRVVVEPRPDGVVPGLREGLVLR